ncbi:MAG: hypothetical protein OXC30_05460, partial [Alphaproteobacteria bacterium]|nr:hypothetical protein [Alphaproteobacteria bacterium]
MINIIIFSLFMCILNAEAAEDPGWLTGAAAQRNSSILQSNLATYGITVEKSLLLDMFCALSQPSFFQGGPPLFQGGPPVLQIDIDLILCTLRKKSQSNAQELAYILREQGEEMNGGHITIISAFNQCIPEIQACDVQVVLDFFPQVPDRHHTIHNMEQRYKRQDVQRFSHPLRAAVWEMYAKFQDSQPYTATAEDLAWFGGESAQRYYGNLRSNLESKHVKVEDSIMLQVCCALSQPDFFKKASVWFQLDIEVMLHFLCKESSSNPSQLAKTFREEDEKVSKGRDIVRAFGQCVPEACADDIKKVLTSTPKCIYKRSSTLKRIRRRYRLKGALRFSSEFKDIFSRWNMHSQPHADFVSSTLVEDPRFFIGQAIQQHYADLQSNLKPENITVANSFMFAVCDALSQPDTFQKEHLLLQIDIKTIMYLLWKESARNAEKLAKTFRAEDDEVQHRREKRCHAFGRCVPKMDAQHARNALSGFPSQYVIDTSGELGKANREEMVQNIIIRYTENTGLERFDLLLADITDAVKGPASEKRPWFEVKSVQENYTALRVHLEGKGITVKNSSMLNICSVFSEYDCSQDIHFFVKTDIKTILYLLSKASSSKPEELAQTFREEDDKVRDHQEEMWDAFGRSVPEMDVQGAREALSGFPSQQVIDTYVYLGKQNREQMIENIIIRYTKEKGCERFHSLLEGIALESDEEGEGLLCPDTYDASDASSMHGAFVPQWGQPMQSGVMMPPGCVYQYPPQFQHPHPMHGALVPQWGQPMQSGVMMPPGY